MYLKRMRVMVLAMLILASLPTVTQAAGGLFSRLRANQTRSTQRVVQPASQRATTAQSSTSRLPAGRNYYQGRYYGNLNNRFYGPQYGYF